MSDRWTTKVRRADEADRHYLREAAISAGALRHLSRDTGDTAKVFDVIENFPALDFLRWQSERLPLMRDPRFLALWRDRSMPDLTTDGAHRLLALPAGTLGHEYARWYLQRGLDNIFLEYLPIDAPQRYFMRRTAHLHDLFHFLLGYDPYDPIGEMEVECFLYAQSGAANHVLFTLGYVGFLLRVDPAQLARGVPRLVAAHRLGRIAEPLLLVRWEDEMARPIDDVRGDLGLAARPLAAPQPPPEITPRLAHTVLNVVELDRAVEFYRRVFGYHVTATDRALGVVFLSAGDDHHTIALQERPSLHPLRLVPSLVQGVRRIRALIGGRRSGGRSRAGQPRALPPWKVVRAGLRAGLNHTGYRVRDHAELRAYAWRLRAWGAKLVWAVNHGDVVDGLYFEDPAGHLIELFVDGPDAQAMRADLAAGTPIESLPGATARADFASYQLDTEDLW